MRMKLWLALGAATVIALSATAGTFALFTASTANSNNQFQAGTLTLSSWRDQGDTVPGPMFYTTPAEGNTGVQDGLLPTGVWAPGDQHMRVLLVRNTGSLDGWLSMIGADLAAGSMHLAQKLEYTIRVDNPGGPVISSGILADLINTDVSVPVGTVELKSFFPMPVTTRPPKAFYFFVRLPLDADNSYQGEQLKVDFHLQAVQKKNNP